MNRLDGIQYLRAFAALGVVVFHAAERTGGHFVIGAAGVDVFFVVSGFIMWVISDRRQMTQGRFLRERLERIAPVYWIATGVMVFGAMAGLFPNMKLTFGHVVASLLFIPHRSPSNGEIWPVLVQGWTLNYEMFFYAAFAGSLLLPARMRLGALAALFACLVASGLAWTSTGPILSTFTNLMILEFLAGAVIGELWVKGRIPRPTVGAALIAAALLGFAFIGTTHVGFGPLSFGLLAAALLVGVLSLERAGAVVRVRPIVYLGDGSYSIYLWHTMAVSVTAKLASLLAIPPATAMIVAVLSGVATGVGAYELVERPWRKVFKRRRGRQVERQEIRGDLIPQNGADR